MSLVLPNPTLGPGVVNSSELVENFSAIATKFGNVDNSDIKASAGIELSKLAASYEYVTVNLEYRIVGAGTFPAANTVLAVHPMYNDGKGAWSTAAYSWATNDVGAQTGAVTLQWGKYDASGTWATTSTIVSGELLNGGTNNTPFQDGATNSTSLAWTQSAMAFRLIVATQDATALFTDGDFLTVNVLLKRQITT